MPLLAGKLGHGVARNAAVDCGIGDTIAPQTVRPMHTARVFACREKPLHLGTAVGLENKTPHQVVGRGDHFHFACCKVKAAVCTALNHAFELFAHLLGAKVRHRYVDTPMRRHSALTHLGKNSTRDDITGCTLELCVVVLHKTLVLAIEQPASRAAKTFFNDGSSNACLTSCKQTCRVELNHLHVSKRKTCTQCHCKSIAAFIAGGRMVFVHSGPTTGCKQNSLCQHESIGAGAHINH